MQNEGAIMTDERTAVAAFLKKCNAYAHASIKRKQERGDVKDIPKWTAYIEFNEHALEEIANGTLDKWFEPTNDPKEPPLVRLDVDTMELLSGALGSTASCLPALSSWPEPTTPTVLVTSHRCPPSCRCPPLRPT